MLFPPSDFIESTFIFKINQLNNFGSNSKFLFIESAINLSPRVIIIVIICLYLITLRFGEEKSKKRRYPHMRTHRRIGLIPKKIAIKLNGSTVTTNDDMVATSFISCLWVTL